jgi:hypothetical protein
MAFTVDQLLLRPDRKAQLTKALANLGVADPLALVITEATADVARYLTGYVVAESSQHGWIRAIALWKAHVAGELEVPADIQKAYDEAIEELTAIAEGKRPNIPKTPASETPTASSGAWGGETKIPLR